MHARIISTTIVFGLLAVLMSSPGYSQDDAQYWIQKARGRMASVTSFAANVRIQFGTEAPLTGQVKYRSPGQIYAKFSNGKLLATNGIKLWLFNPKGTVTGEQDVKENRIGGFGGLVYNTNGIVITSGADGARLKLKKAGSDSTIMLQMDGTGFVTSYQLLNEKGESEILVKLVNVQTNLGIPSSVFSYHPPSNSKTILNPLNYQK